MVPEREAALETELQRQKCILVCIQCPKQVCVCQNGDHIETQEIVPSTISSHLNQFFSIGPFSTWCSLCSNFCLQKLQLLCHYHSKFGVFTNSAT